MALVSSVVFSVFDSSVFGNISGAFFTTNSGCGSVDLNTYKFKQDVYLDVGPRKPGSAGLPQGEYYVQVISPSGILLGTNLGTNDEIPVEVDENGQFVTCYQLCEILMIPGVAITSHRNSNSCGYADAPLLNTLVLSSTVNQFSKILYINLRCGQMRAFSRHHILNQRANSL